MFQKENLCKILEKIIPAEYTKLFFMDSDIIFDRPHWYDETSLALDSYDVVHPFSTALWFDVSYTAITQTRPSIVLNPHYKTMYQDGLKLDKYHPG